MTTAPDPVHEAAEEVLATSYGRLVAYLAARSGDLAAAEDALADAVEAALRTWPSRGVPDRPEAWLLTAARRRLIAAARHRGVAERAAPSLVVLADEAAERATTPSGFPDERLGLLFACTHPAIDERVRAPLMLQTVLGLDAARIASAFVVAPSTMGQRLVRAKAKVKAAGVPFTVPGPDQLGDRLGSVLEAVYAAYGTGWDDLDGRDPRRAGLAVEAERLAGVVVELAPHEPEARGLAALIGHCEARRPARRDTSGGFVPLTEQDTDRWDHPRIAAADALLGGVGTNDAEGRFVLEARIQSAHNARRRTGATDWAAVGALYDRLLVVAPTVGAAVAAAAAWGEARGPAVGLARLDALPVDRVEGYQPAWALRADLARRLGLADVALEAYDRAIGLSDDPAVRAFLLGRRAEVAAPPGGLALDRAV